MSQFIDDKKKDLLMFMVDEMIPSDLYEDRDFDESLDFVISNFIKKPSLLLSFFSVRSLSFIRDKLNGTSKDDTFKRGLFLLEDYSALIYLGIVDYETLEINVKYNEVLHEALKIGEADSIVYNNTLLKGLIDLYGYCDIESLKRIYLNTIDSSKSPDEISLTKLIESSGLIYPHVYIHDDVIFRRELQEKLSDFIELRTRLNPNLKDYKLFSTKEILFFQSRFTFLEDVKYLRNNDWVTLYLNRTFFILQDPASFIKDHRVNKESKELINKYNQYNPKWYLLGRTIEQHKKYLTEEEEKDEEENA